MNKLFVPVVQIQLYILPVQRLKLYNILSILLSVCPKTHLYELSSSTSVLVELGQIRPGKFLEQWQCRSESLAPFPPMVPVGEKSGGGLCSCCLCSCSRQSCTPNVNGHQILVIYITTCCAELLLNPKYYSTSKGVSLQGFAGASLQKSTFQ